MNDELEDRMLEAALEVQLGGQASEELTQRILRAAGEQARQPPASGNSGQRPALPRRRRRRRRRLPGRSTGARWGLVLLGLAAAAALLLFLFGPRADAPAEPDQQAESPQQRPEQLAENRQPPAPVDERQPETPPETPPEPRLPELLPEPPIPEPQPEPLLPEPQPEPEAQPEPEPLPEVVVERDPGTETPAPPTLLATVAHADRGLRVRDDDAAAWRSPEPDEPLFAGMTLKTRGSSTLRLGDGQAVVRFDGELRLEEHDAAPRLVLLDDALFVDNLGCEASLELASDSLVASLNDGALYLERGRGKVLFACLAGDAALAGAPLAAGTSRLARRGELEAPEPFDFADLRRGAALLADLPVRELWQEDFGRPPPGLEAGVVAEGLARCSGDGSSIELDFPAEQPVLPGMRVRLRLRAEGVQQLVLQCFDGQVNLNFRVEIRQLPGADFASIEVDCARMFATVDRTRPLEPSNVLRNLQLHIYGAADARLEVDSVALLRRFVD